MDFTPCKAPWDESCKKMRKKEIVSRPRVCYTIRKQLSLSWFSGRGGLVL